MDGGAGGVKSVELQLAEARLEALMHEFTAANLTVSLMQYRIPEIQRLINVAQSEIKSLSGGSNGPANH